MIPNHNCARLSELDLQIAAAVPPGGNWRNIPESIPSERLAQIRVSAAAGEGSRSTYYGRLHPDKPAYTINTYYNRPGNGCFLHYDFNGGQHRTLSHREAARLQSFPDSFIFHGSQRAVCQQIGNAVPPILALQIAHALGQPGAMIDVFAGAGGLSLGFELAGWQSIAAVDSDRHAVASFNANIAPVAFAGDMNDESVHSRLCELRRERQTARLALVGGPPCQGFSTGGNRRSSEDIRNGLHQRYAVLLANLRPDVFVFENVLGLLSMESGKFVARIMDGLRAAGYEVAMWRLNAAEFGVPQRRERVIIVGVPIGEVLPSPPRPWTDAAGRGGLFTTPRTCSVQDALGDLPPLRHGEDGSHLAYRLEAAAEYQKLSRGLLSPDDYLRGAARSNDQAGPTGALRRVTDGPAAIHTR
jgi:DNA (cytosine-5)-methyltransferase 1